MEIADYFVKTIKILPGAKPRPGDDEVDNK